MRQRLEHHDLVDTVQELRFELLFQQVDHREARPLDNLFGQLPAVEGLGEVILDHLRTHVRGHNDDRVAEIHRTALVVGQPAVVEHLQQDVEDVGVRLLDLVEQHHGIGLAPHGLGQLAALVVTDVSRRRPDEPRHGVPLLVLAHVDTRHHLVVVEQELGQRLGQLGLADARRTEEDERTDRLAGIVQPGARTAHGVGNGRDGLLLPDDALVEFVLHVEQFLALRGQHARHGNARPARHHLGNVLRVDLLLDHRTAGRSEAVLLLESGDLLLGLLNLAVADFGHLAVVALPFGLPGLDFQRLDLILVGLNLFEQIALALPPGTHLGVTGLQFLDLLGQVLDALLVLLAADGLALDFELADPAVERVDLLGHGVHLQTQPRGGLVHQVDGLVGQEPRGDVARRKLDGGHDGLVLDPHLVVVFVTLLQAAEDRDGVLLRRLVDHHLLETAFEGLVLLEVFLELVERRGSDGPQLAPRKGRFEDVRGIHRPRRLAGADQRVDLVDEEQYLALAGRNLLHDGFQTLLELALILGACDQRTHVQRVDDLRLQVLGHVAVDDPAGDALGDGGFADAGLAHENRIVLRAPRKDLQHAADLLVTPDDRVEFSRARLLVEVDGILAQRVELLLGGLRIDRRTLAEGADRLDQLLFRRAAAFEDVGGLPALGHEGQQQVFDGGVFVAEILREVHGALDRLRGVLRKELLAAALDARQRRHGPADLVAQRTYIHSHAPQQERRERIVLADQHREQVERFDSLLSPLPRQRERRLQRLLRLDGKSVDVHNM